MISRIPMIGATVVALSVSGLAAQAPTSVPPLPLAVSTASLQDGGVLDVTFSNTGETMFTAWSLKVVYVMPDGTSQTTWASTDRLRTAAYRRAGLQIDVREGVAPGETMKTRVTLPVTTARAAAEAACVVFEDGTGAGEPECLRRIYKTREALAEACSRWAGVLNRSLDSPVDKLAARSIREAAQAHTRHRPPSVSSNDDDFAQTLAQLAARGEEGVPGFRAEAQRLLHYWVALKSEALKHVR